MVLLFVCSLFWFSFFFFFFCFSPPSPGCPAPPPPPLPLPAAAGDEAARGAPQPPLTPSFSPAVLRAPLPSLPCLFSPPCLSYSLLSATLGATRGLAHPISSPPSFPPVTATPSPVKSDAPLVQDAAGNSHTPSPPPSYHPGRAPRPWSRIWPLSVACQAKDRATLLSSQPSPTSPRPLPRIPSLSSCAAPSRPEHHHQGSLGLTPSQPLVRTPRWPCPPHFPQSCSKAEPVSRALGHSPGTQDEGGTEIFLESS